MSAIFSRGKKNKGLLQIFQLGQNNSPNFSSIVTYTTDNSMTNNSSGFIFLVKKCTNFFKNSVLSFWKNFGHIVCFSLYFLCWLKSKVMVFKSSLISKKLDAVKKFWKFYSWPVKILLNISFGNLNMDFKRNQVDIPIWNGFRDMTGFVWKPCNS